ncbi:hypothetical protein ACP70R_024369 [Stipagrostis hirtigluma subsp. patula]
MAIAAVDAAAPLPRDASAPPPVLAGWALFDTRVALGDLANSAAAVVSKTTNGREVRVSLRLAKPPAASCVELYTDDEVFTNPSILSTDGDLILLHMVVAVKGMYYVKFPHNFFVYKADPEWPRMQSLPPPCDPIVRAEHTGIARSGEDFVLANLMSHDVFDDTDMRKVEVAFLQLYRSETEQWETKRLRMPIQPENGLEEYQWETDTVFSFRGFVCWVDYHHGILYCNVFSPDPDLAFLRFPGVEMWSNDRGLPTRYRTVSICRGHLKFVDVDNGQFRSTERGNNGAIERANSGCSIRTWTLKMPGFKWEEDMALGLEELLSLRSYQDSPLPRVVPTYPVISLQKANVLHFIVKGPGLFDKAWMVTFDMKKKSLEQHALYENPMEEDCAAGLGNVFPDSPMVSIQLFK